MIWAAAGAIAGALFSALRTFDLKTPGQWHEQALHVAVFSTTGAFVGSSIYVMLFYTLYDMGPFWR